MTEADTAPADKGSKEEPFATLAGDFSFGYSGADGARRLFRETIKESMRSKTRRGQCTLLTILHSAQRRSGAGSNRASGYLAIIMITNTSHDELDGKSSMLA